MTRNRRRQLRGQPSHKIPIDAVLYAECDHRYGDEEPSKRRQISHLITGCERRSSCHAEVHSKNVGETRFLRFGRSCKFVEVSLIRGIVAVSDQIQTNVLFLPGKPSEV